MTAKAVYLRDLVDEVPDSVPPPPPPTRVTPKTLPPPPRQPVLRGRPNGGGTLDLHRGVWTARFSVTDEDGHTKRIRVSLDTASRSVAEERLRKLAADMDLGRKPHQPTPGGKKIGNADVVTRVTHPAEHTSWKLAKRRCTNPEDNNWRYYGGRGVLFHEAWIGENGFKQFLLDMGPKPTKDHVLGRKDKNGHIDPDNSVWMLRGDVRVGVRKKYDVGLDASRVLPLITIKGREPREARAFERNNLIRFEGLEGGLTPNEADELARHLICIADAMRRRRRVNAVR